MRTYRILWLTAASVLGLLGTVAGLASLEGEGLAICAVVGMIAGSGWETTRARSGGREPGAGDVAVKAGTGIVAVAAVAGLFSLLGEAAALLLLVLVATSPPVGRRYLGHLAARPSPRAPRGSSTRADHDRAQRVHMDAAQDRWRRINGHELVALVRAGATFIDGKLQERSDQQTSTDEETTDEECAA